MNGDVSDLLVPLAFSAHLARIAAAGTNLSGSLPNLHDLVGLRVDGISYTVYNAAPLARALQVLDLAKNSLSEVKGLSAQAVLSLASNPSLKIPESVFSAALEGQVQLDLTDTRIEDMAGARALYQKGAFTRTKQLTSSDFLHGFACYSLRPANVKVTPHLFLPEVLCGCLEGWMGTGSQCHRCLKGTYNTIFNRTDCLQCPLNSDSVEGSTSRDSCKCKIGRTGHTCVYSES